MNYKFTKYGIVNGLISLIPIIPAFTLFPLFLIIAIISEIFNDCVLSYIITLILCFSLATGIIFKQYFLLKSHIEHKTDNIKSTFRIISFINYSIVNSLIFLLIVGNNVTCSNDGQTGLGFIYSGPIASIYLILYGFLIDIIITKNKTIKHEA